ncbi:MAG: hypothetical protein U5J63_04010 [Fodinibius sp.]|nr:hypothetical protein [Fodinibius sp.]
MGATVMAKLKHTDLERDQQANDGRVLQIVFRKAQPASGGQGQGGHQERRQRTPARKSSASGSESDRR